eukprot:4082615-Prymnesium_polylepis.1
MSVAPVVHSARARRTVSPRLRPATVPGVPRVPAAGSPPAPSPTHPPRGPHSRVCSVPTPRRPR